MADEMHHVIDESKEEESQCSGQLCDDSKAGYEYLDHTSDVQIHAWGETLKESFEFSAVAMTGYMTDLESVEISQEEEVNVEGHDLESLLFNFLDEVLFLFCAEPYLTSKEVEIIEFDNKDFKIKAICRGEPFDLSKHPQGTEIKAITYSNMQIYDKSSTNDVYVIVDI
ncbi:protein archease-like [Rhopilema esculentum]|uniref:protein archease-like n=1 Tax=Rhopilema esculentum TaxID=499914 RepID=UPI0031D41075